MFTNSIILVTGGIEGIGEATVKEIISKNGKVIILDNQPLENNEILNKSDKVFFYLIDLENTKELEKLCKTIKEKFKEIDGIVNNVGFFSGDGLNSDINEWDKSLKINILSTYIIVKELKNNKLKSIVNISSISGMIAQKNYLIYNTMKAAIINMTKCLALELADYNIRCNSISPGTVWTKKNEFYIGKSHNLNKNEADKHPDFGGKSILKRVCDPEEIAKPITFLLSNESSYITGENLVVDGGTIAL